MLAKFLIVEEATSIAPHSTVKVKLKDANLSNVWFIFPAVEFAARGLILANAGLLLWPAEARVYNTKDVSQNISAGDCIAINVQMENEGLKWGELQAPDSADEVAETETAESDEPASPENTAAEESAENPEGSEPAADSEESTEENAAADEVAATETDESPEEEAPKKSSRSKK